MLMAAFAIQQIKQMMDRFFCNFLDRLTDRRQGRIVIAAQLNSVKARNRIILRDPFPASAIADRLPLPSYLKKQTLP